MSPAILSINDQNNLATYLEFGYKKLNLGTKNSTLMKDLIRILRSGDIERLNFDQQKTIGSIFSNGLLVDLIQQAPVITELKNKHKKGNSIQKYSDSMGRIENIKVEQGLIDNF